MTNTDLSKSTYILNDLPAHFHTLSEDGLPDWQKQTRLKDKNQEIISTLSEAQDTMNSVIQSEFCNTNNQSDIEGELDFSLSGVCSDKAGNQNTTDTRITDFQMQHLDNLIDPNLDLNTNTSLDFELDFNDWIDLNSSSELCSSNRDLEVISRPTSTCATTATQQGKKSDTDSISITNDNTTIPSFEACLFEFELRPSTTLADDAVPAPIRARKSETSIQEASSTRRGSKRKADTMGGYRGNQTKKSSRPSPQGKRNPKSSRRSCNSKSKLMSKKSVSFGDHDRYSTEGVLRV
ncbi:hypothetical protein I204_00439 [Kwoniella mangroviensis CBS 8886]|nr:hypothetical protein I204_00439 [Kwoniella mangroviensis CBS 8886]